jgi:hypothetical protein
MRRGALKKVGVSFGLVFVLFLVVNSWSQAQQGICVFPTGTEEVVYPPAWHDSVLAVYSSADTVRRGNTIQVWLEADGHGCPPYQWQVSGRGFHFESTAGPTTATTDGDGEMLDVWAGSTACGAAVITVMDGCGAVAEVSIREPGHGRWVLVEEISCGTLRYTSGSGTCETHYSCIEGAYRYQDTYVAGTTMYTRWEPIGNCTKYPCTPYDRDYCHDAGFYYPFGHVGIYYKKKWRWDCS